MTTTETRDYANGLTRRQIDGAAHRCLRRKTARFWIFIGTLLSSLQSAMGVASVDDQVKRIAQRYNQVEAQLGRSVFYTDKDNSGAHDIIKQAWFNGADDLIKASAETNDGSSRELIEYVALDFDNGYNGMFVLTRKETPLPDGGMQVEESRKYFGEVVIKDKETTETGAALIRELRKRARFKNGEAPDTVHTPNVVIDLNKDANQPDEAEIRQIMSAPERIADELKEGTPARDPFANVKGDSDKFHVIHGTASPDGRYAIAIGLPKDESDWDAVYDQQTQSYFYEPGISDYDMPNYVVDLAGKKIVGETHCGYFGTRRRYNHRQCIVTWSADAQKFVQLWDDKWSSTACMAGVINARATSAAAVDLLKAITKKTYAFVKNRSAPDEDDAGLSLNVKSIGNDGAIDLEASETCASGDCKGETIFAVSERLRLRETPGGLQIEVGSLRRLSNDR